MAQITNCVCLEVGLVGGVWFCWGNYDGWCDSQIGCIQWVRMRCI